MWFILCSLLLLLFPPAALGNVTPTTAPTAQETSTIVKGARTGTTSSLTPPGRRAVSITCHTASSITTVRVAARPARPRSSPLRIPAAAMTAAPSRTAPCATRPISAPPVPRVSPTCSSMMKPDGRPAWRVAWGASCMPWMAGVCSVRRCTPSRRTAAAPSVQWSTARAASGTTTVMPARRVAGPPRMGTSASRAREGSALRPPCGATGGCSSSPRVCWGWSWCAGAGVGTEGRDKSRRNN
ncbi:alginate regulatory protein AlgP [Angomonas deanei]|uniref:Uncharacterized protein n=1 Tax=Angomonas deanei TaxID=59799 RepID=A0A7G2CTC6_9TRYP|nr:alginate regulatory protein AlgP [Angomonas deanei]CAD2221693.1 hypothetical protein, conserved [Angomonas deanei]|eukprot:EPY17321.1 alginate regulatory protein AlgP [Angomonas deanei]